MLKRPRVIPCLSLKNKELVKTIGFSGPRYLGDPINAVKIFNGKDVDELCVLDISATSEKNELDYIYLQEIASEAFMPLSYGGGISNMKQIEKIFYIGYEKVVINTALVTHPDLVDQAVKHAGSQSVVASIDVKKDFLGRKFCWIGDGSVNTKIPPIELAKKAEAMGCGEILLNSIDKDGRMRGYDLQLVREISQGVSIPVIACGGAGKISDLKAALAEGAHAVAAGSLFVYYGANRAVLINFPSETDLISAGIYSAYQL